MAFLKRYPIFVAILAICVLLFVIEAFFLYRFRQNADLEQEKLDSARSALNSTLGLQPAPTAENQALAQRNVVELKADLDEILATFQKTSVQIPPAPADAPALMLDIQSYVDRMRVLTRSKNVLTPPESSFGFGMKQYLGGAFPPPKEKIQAVFKQAFVLEYILQHLINDCKPAAEWMVLRSVLRENVEAADADKENVDQRMEQFLVDPLISARSKGSVDTYAFRIDYVGRSESFRMLLNTLARFELPLVVRSVDVKPPEADDLRELAKTVAHQAGDSAGAATPATPAPTSGGGTPMIVRDPVIADNYSQFTIVIEYIELTLTKSTPATEPGATAPAADAAADAVAPETAPAAEAGTPSS